MFIPIRTDYRMRRKPWVNYALIAANVIVYFLQFNGATPRNMARINEWLLHPDSPQLYQFVSSVFLHGGLMHLLGNMVFLWVFGNAVNDRFGNLGYLAFYLAGGVLACIGYVLMSGRAPVLGASGAISAVTGAYLVLLPRARVTLLVLFYVITTFEISSLYFLIFQFVWNLWMSLYGGFAGASSGVAYVAHSSGYVFGILVAALLLAIRVLPRDAFDLLNLLRSGRRRSRYRRMVAHGYDPFNYVQPAGGTRNGRSVNARVVDTMPSETISAREMQLRQEISDAARINDMPTAADKYLELVQIAEDAVLPRQQQLDVANQLMATERYPSAADAYERFLKHYGNYEHTGDIYLMLGLLYGRYLAQYDRAEQFLQQAIDKLHDSRKIELARAEIGAVRYRKSQ